MMTMHRSARGCAGRAKAPSRSPWSPPTWRQRGAPSRPPAPELTRAGADDSVRTIVLNGTGDYFCGGRDRNNFDGPGAGRITMQHGLDETISNFPNVLAQLIDSPRPTIAAVRGYARAGLQALMLACDFVVAERTATFGNPEPRLGFPAAPDTVLLARHLGRRRALEIAISAPPTPPRTTWPSD